MIKRIIKYISVISILLISVGCSNNSIDNDKVFKNFTDNGYVVTTYYQHSFSLENEEENKRMDIVLDKDKVKEIKYIDKDSVYDIYSNGKENDKSLEKIKDILSKVEVESVDELVEFSTDYYKTHLKDKTIDYEKIEKDISTKYSMQLIEENQIVLFDLDNTIRMDIMLLDGKVSHIAYGSYDNTSAMEIVYGENSDQSINYDVRKTFEQLITDLNISIIDFITFNNSFYDKNNADLQTERVYTCKIDKENESGLTTLKYVYFVKGQRVYKHQLIRTYIAPDWTLEEFNNLVIETEGEDPAIIRTIEETSNGFDVIETIDCLTLSDEDAVRFGLDVRKYLYQVEYENKSVETAVGSID
ncbi:MAG: hypothetical protein ACK5LC_06835 [Coprobacillaceae bacterium]